MAICSRQVSKMCIRDREVENTSGDLIIAIGGGSVMDAAKLCCVLKDADYTIKDLLNDPTVSYTHLDVYKRQLLNTAKTDLNVVVGLCVGHDSLFYNCLLYTSRCV